MSRLIRWNTPFADVEFPSIFFLIKPISKERDELIAIVAPTGIDEYPKYLINFGIVLAFTCFEEAYCPPRDFDANSFEENDLCAYEYLDSPWLQSYEPMRYFWGKDVVSYSHYVIFGGDNNLEVITPNEPIIEVIESKTNLTISLEI